jgi:hypothetical protein
MKHQEIVFNKPAKVVQVFRMINEYGKDEKSFADRKDKLVWKDIASKSGYVKDTELYLSSSILNDKKLGNCHLITIEDEADITPQHEYKIINKKYGKGNNHCFNLHHRSSFEIFYFQHDPIELSLNYSYYYIGDPTRDNFVITILEKDVPVEIKINGKIDSSRGRHFKEQNFIFHLLGEYDRCFILNDTDAAIVKTVPENRKVIDLLKPLW